MGVGHVLAFKRNAAGDTVKLDFGGDDNATAEHFADAGDDSVPLAGDAVATSEGVGENAEQVTGYADETPKKALLGEKRIYARSPAGAVVAEIWLKGDGTIAIQTDAAVEINGASQSALRGEDFLTYLDAVINGVSAAFSALAPAAVSGPAVAALNLAVSNALPLRLASLSEVLKVE